MRISLDSILRVADEKQASLVSKSDSDTQKLAEDLTELQTYIHRLETLAKIACFQNDISFASDNEAKLEKIGSALELPIKSADLNILNKFASFFKEFANKNKQKEIEKKAEEITTKMIDSGLVSAEDVLSKLSELKEKSIEDLTILDKALDLHKQGEFLSLGTLSDRHGAGAISPKDQFVSDLLD